MNKVFITKNTLGDTRTAEHMPTREEFNDANESHIDDVKLLTRSFCDEMLERISHHDWTKMSEPYATMFYDDMKANIEDGKEPFTDMEWYKLHVNTERHHLNDRVPDDVDLIDVFERLVDCVSAGMARSGSVYDIAVPDDVLQKAVANTVKKMINAVIVYEGKGSDAEMNEVIPRSPYMRQSPDDGADLISRQAAIDVIDAVFPVDPMKSEYAQGIACGAALAKTYVEQLPSAQPEIIQCKDCKWYGRVHKRRFYRGMDCLQKHIDTIVPDRDFCSKAERRGEQDG